VRQVHENRDRTLDLSCVPLLWPADAPAPRAAPTEPPNAR
jgi:hypothetical protein